VLEGKGREKRKKRGAPWSSCPVGVALLMEKTPPPTLGNRKESCRASRSEGGELGGEWDESAVDFVAKDAGDKKLLSAKDTYSSRPPGGKDQG